jgi:hypothetical protein
MATSIQVVKEKKNPGVSSRGCKGVKEILAG